MDSDAAHLNLPNIIEDDWWDSPHDHPSLYHHLPPSSQWISRLQQDPKTSESLVEVQIENTTYLFSRYYLPLFMIVEIHQLCSLAVSQRWVATSEQHTNALKNVHFVDCLRKHLLEQSTSGKTVGGPVDHLLKRLIIRIMKGAPYGKSRRDHIRDLYAEYSDDVCWQLGKILLKPPKTHSFYTRSFLMQHSTIGP